MKSFRIRHCRAFRARTLAPLLAFALAAGALAAIEAQAGPYRIRLTTQPRVVALGNVRLDIAVTDASGTPLEDLEVFAIARMPGMNMGERERRANRSAGAKGLYTATQPFSMTGAYEVQVRIKGPAGEASARIPVRTGQDTGGEGGDELSLWKLVPWAVGILGLLFIFIRVRKSGQRMDLRALLNGSVLGGLALLALLFAAAVWAVNNLRRPGAMTPLEAQVMEMNTPAPPGVTAVSLALLSRGEVRESVRYSGQAVGYVEIEVAPRVAGTIVSMPIYVGDRVTKGQVVARLDTSQADPQVAERAAMSDMAIRGAEIAASEHQTALREISEARADLQARQAAVEEARANKAAAIEEVRAREAVVEAAMAKLEDAKAEIQSAQKNQDFWSAEVKRARELFEKGVIARANLQRTEADAAKAETELHHAHQGLRQAESERVAARAEVARANAMVTAAEKKIVQAQAEVRTAQATIRARESEADGKRQAISRERAAISQARASYQGAAVQRGYSELKSEIDGVVMRRLVSPGTLVSPGQAVLEIAQVAPIRLQANVPEVDLRRISVGTWVTIAANSGASRTLRARVASVAPALDRDSRMATVEVIYDNRDGRFRPGQYLTMDFEVGGSATGLTAPAGALRPSLEPDRFPASVWIASPTAVRGHYTVRRVDVQVLAKDGKLAAVESTELREGQYVVVQGGATLREGDLVDASVDRGSESAFSIEVSAAGFQPDTIEVEAGKETVLTFTRISEEGCGTEVVFPDLGIEQSLPLNKPTEVRIRPKHPGTIRFSCGMDMLRGKVVAR